MQTGENEQALRKIIDLTRLIGMTILAIHLYLYCYSLFESWKLIYPIVNQMLIPVSKMPVFHTAVLAKASALLMLLISLIGSKGKKNEQIKLSSIVLLAGSGMLLYWGSCLFMQGQIANTVLIAYILFSILGYLLIMTGGALLARMLKVRLNRDIFNHENETFPQEERLLVNEYSINLPAEYQLKQKKRKSWINIINPFRGSLVMGTPGAGKSYFVIRHYITQHIKKGFAMFLYDFKFPDLSTIAYNTLEKYHHVYKKRPEFCVINFEDLSRTHRCNPLEPASMLDITDAMESSLTFMLGLNREWIKKQSDFFVQSPINFVTALIWFLRKYKDGRYCTLPHVIELAQLDYKQLFPLLRKEPEIEVLINPFISAYENEAFDQLEGQIASAKISMARLVSPSLYYVLSGNDFDLALNDPENPKVVCMGNNPLKQQVYGAVLSLYISRTIKLVNQKNKLKCNLIFDEFPTIFFNNIDGLIATARSNKVATTLAVQDYSQLKKDYGREQAEVIMSIIGNVISGQVTGDTAKQLSERFGKIMQDRESLTINSNDTSINRSGQLEMAIPASKIAGLSSGEFVGTVADDPDQKIALKTFHNAISNDHGQIKAEESGYEPLPEIRKVTVEELNDNYMMIKNDIRELAEELL
jgi:hypothetical protein